MLARAMATIAPLVAGTAAAAEPFSTRDIALEAAFMVVAVADYRQTLDIRNHPGYHEQNPLLGDHPSDVKVRNYFLAMAAGHTVITYLLPPKYRLAWQGSTLAIGVIVVHHNKMLGLSYSF